MSKKVKEQEAPKVEEKKGIVAKIKEAVTKKPALEKVNVLAKQIGKNLNIVVGEEKFTRVGDKEELSAVKESINSYNTKPTKSNFEAMMKLIKPATAKKEEEEVQIKADIKATKKKVKEEETTKSKTIKVADVVKEIDEKLMSNEELDEMEAAIKRQRAKKEPEAKTTSSPRSGESYRRY